MNDIAETSLQAADGWTRVQRFERPARVVLAGRDVILLEADAESVAEPVFLHDSHGLPAALSDAGDRFEVLVASGKMIKRFDLDGGLISTIELVPRDGSLNPSRRTKSPISLPFFLDENTASPRSNGFDLGNLSSPRPAQDFRRAVLAPENRRNEIGAVIFGCGCTGQRRAHRCVEAGDSSSRPFLSPCSRRPTRRVRGRDAR